MELNTQSHADTGMRPVAHAAPRDLDALAELTAEQLLALFVGAQPGSLTALNGHPRGRMLAVPRLDRGAPAAILRAVAAAPLFVWEGKSFAAAPGSSSGRGINRVRAGGRRSAFRFHTYETRSLLDGAPCLAIDYDMPDNPLLARSTYDELRALGNGLFLGRGLSRSKRGARLLLWFGLDTRVQDAAVPF